MRCICNSCLERLTAYEATGLEPEDCMEYKKFEDNLVKSGVAFSRIIELVKAEQNRQMSRGMNRGKEDT